MSGYVQVEFIGGVDTALQPAFDTAAAFWNQVINDGAQSVTFNTNTDVSSACGVDFTIPAGTTLNGLTVFSSTPLIDGEGSILGRAGPCLFDTNLLRNSLPIAGIMEFDSADAFNLLNDGQFEAVIVHEMGHVIGIGTVWSRRGLVTDPCGFVAGIFGNCDPTYNGAGGISGFQEIGGARNTEVPVANTGGSGTANGHWRESTFENELMTGFLNSGIANPLSVMTIRSLTDMGYDVNENAQESYTLPSFLSSVAEGETLEFLGDTLFFEGMSAEELQAVQIETGGKDYSAEFSGIFSIMILGFFALGAMMFVMNKKQQRAIEKLQQESGVRVTSPMHLKAEP